MDVDPQQYEHVSISDKDVHKIVLSYLVHNCFKDTAEAFVAGTEIECSLNSLAEMETRKRIYNSVLEGQVLKAINLTNGFAEDLLATSKDIHFKLLRLHFLELVRSNDCNGALDFAQKELQQYGGQEKYIDMFQDCMALLAYSEPQISPLQHLLSVEHRHSVADVLNCALLRRANLPPYAALETLLKQLTVVTQLQGIHLPCMFPSSMFLSSATDTFSWPWLLMPSNLPGQGLSRPTDPSAPRAVSQEILYQQWQDAVGRHHDTKRREVR